MEDESKERSVSRESNDESRQLSLSEGSIVDKDSSRSPGSSESGTLKKPRKFRPRKFISKRFKLKKSDKNGDELEQTTAESELELSRKSSTTSKSSSPRLSRFNFIKRFSGAKSVKVSPSFDGGPDDTKSNLKTLGKFSVSESNVKKSEIEFDNKSQTTDVVSFEEYFAPIDETKTSGYASTSSKETVTLESKKVQLKITMTGKKKESGISQVEVDRASQSRESTTEASQHRTDIILPSTSNYVRLTTARDQFFNKSMSEIENAGPQVKPIIDDPTFADVVKEGLSVRVASSKESKEIEKYLVLTSSLNTIISAAKELDDLSSNTNDIISFDEVKTHETEVDPNSEGETIEEIIGIGSSEKEEFVSSTPISRKGQKSVDAFTEDSDEMRRQSGDKDSLTTVRTQEANKPYHRNLSSPSSEKPIAVPSKNDLNAVEIKFEVGTPVRPQRTSAASSTSDVISKFVDESFHSAENEDSLQSETRRRRIAYVPQLTIYTPEEQEFLKSSILANASDSLDTTADSSIFPVFDDSAVRTCASLHFSSMLSQKH